MDPVVFFDALRVKMRADVGLQTTAS